MNINEYIKKYSQIDEGVGSTLTITMCVPPRKLVDYAWEENDDTKHITVNTSDVHNYLKGKGYQNLKTESSHTIDNKHSTELSKSWEFTHTKNKPQKSKRKASKVNEK